MNHSYLEWAHCVAAGEPRSTARTLLISALLCAAALIASTSAQAATPIVTDSRIKTFVYNENEVFTVTTHYGYQSNIEFGLKETIDTVSVGDRVAWQIIPSGRRLFIRAMEENAHTNMTIVTNLRAYQFDLRSSSADAVFGSEELTYVVRFFYPSEGSANYSPVSYAPPAPMSAVVPAVVRQPAPIIAAPVVTAPAPMPIAAAPVVPPAIDPTGYNYRYTYSGPSNLAPVKIYDDGKTTYFKFTNTPPPQFAVITARGEELGVPTRPAGPNIVAVDIIAPRFSLRGPNAQVVVYNESNGTS